LRHKSQSSSDAAGATNDIDRSLMSLDERLETVSKGVKSINDALEPLLDQNSTDGKETLSSEEAVILRKHAAFMLEWEAAQSESETLRDELKEDKWLIVFRTVTEQAGGLMTSLEKGVSRCQVRTHVFLHNLGPTNHMFC
jgi:Yeast cortical protein KAR9